MQSFTSQATARNKPNKLHKTVYLWSSNRCMEQVYGEQKVSYFYSSVLPLRTMQEAVMVVIVW
jgi:hypothetical protein